MIWDIELTQLTVLLDACVLYPAPLRSYLMYLANTGLFRARWSADIHDEWIRNVLAKRPDLTREQLERVRQLMDAHVPDALISGYEPLIPTLNLPDADDRHVLAAAITSHVDEIVTFNTKDFPANKLDPFGICAVHPDDFLCAMYELSPAACLKAAQQHRASLKKPPFGGPAYLEMMQRQQIPTFVALLRPMSLML